MKSIVRKITGLLLISAVAVNSFGQTSNKAKLPIDETTKLITYSKVEQLAGAGKDSLYNKALNWCMTYFVNPSDAIRDKNPLEGSIVCKARYKFFNPEDKKGIATEAGNVQYTLKLIFKDARYKYEFSEFNWKLQSYYPCEKWMDTANQYYKPEFDNYLSQLDTKVKEIAESLSKSMSAKGPVKKDDW